MVQVRSMVALRRHCEVKVGNIRKRDLEQCQRCDLDVATLVRMALEHSGVCSECQCEMIFEDYSPFCRYQFSPDRLNRNLPHSEFNIRLVCRNCNVAGPGMRKGPCRGNCHPGELPFGSAPTPPPDEKEVPFPLFLSPEAKATLMKALADQIGEEWEDEEVVTFRPSEGEFQIFEG